MGSSKIQRKKKAAQKKEQEKLLQLSESELREALAIIANDVYETEEEQEQDEEGKELSDKFHNMLVEVVSPFGGAQSWAGLDKFLNAAATSDAVRQTTFEFKTMADNVLNNDDLSPTEKEARITALASGFSRRAGKLADEKKELDDPGTVEVLLDKIGLKQITKREGGANFNVSDFADVPDRSKPSTWKLRLAEGRSGNFTVAPQS